MRVLAFETGGSKLVSALVEQDGRVAADALALRKPRQKAAETIRQLIELGRQVTSHEEAEAIGVGFGGTVERPEGRPAACYHEEGWEEVDLAGELSRAFSRPVFIENDCNLAALAEAHYGFAATSSTLFYLTLGTGIGGGIISAGRILQLSRAGEGEIGHVVVEPDGPVCPCGNSGCLETLCSGPGLGRLARRFDATLTAKELMGGLTAGDPLSRRICGEAADLVAAALAPTINILAPSIVVFGGGVMFRNRPFLEMIRERTLPSIFPPFRTSGIRFELSRLNEQVVCRGAALYALQRLEAT